MADEKKTAAAVYVSWGTFKNSLDRLAEGIPNVVDKSAFTGLAWSVQNQLMAGLKFMGLITDAGVPTTDLAAIAVKDDGARKEALKRILHQRYSAIIALDLTKTTPAQLNEKMTEVYGVNGDTRDRAVRFFISAAQYVGLPLGRFLVQAKPANGSTPRRRRSPFKTTVRSRGDDDASDPPPFVPPSSAPGSTRVITLGGGGTVTVIVAVDLLALPAKDQAFVFGLKANLDEYEKGNSQS